MKLTSITALTKQPYSIQDIDEAGLSTAEFMNIASGGRPYLAADIERKINKVFRDQP